MPIVDTTRLWVPPKLISRSRIVSRTFSIWWRSLSQLLAIAALVHVPLLALKWWLHGAQAGTWRDTLRHALPLLEQTVFAMVIEGLAARLVFQRLRGEVPDVGSSIRHGVRRFGTILAIASIALVAAVIVPASSAVYEYLEEPSTSHGAHRPDLPDFMAHSFGLPWLLYLLVFCVSIPAAIVESLGPLRAFNRSRLLTSGSRLRIVGLWFWFAFTFVLPFGILRALAEAVKEPTFALLANAAYDWLFASLTCVVPIVLYHDLRETKEGIGIEELLRVFE